ncbi:hypothetical protein R3P38DRAFT_1853694 [Favolaschia claudopus]|uniref:Uncharacterized protein n=1 Tax=Favolaschia claudopus TaxID=2862362 RepID=A0AAW0D9C0_9AGAR
MGRWTAEYQDDVFLSKIKGLVSGAIKRSKLEAEPTISYRHVVEDLDTGDSFTTQIIDILVQELAERRLRSSNSPGDRRLIADRTAKSLRMLATPIRIYRERRQSGRRTVNMAEYLTAPPDEMDMEDDDDEFETMLDRATMPVEGVRVNSDLYDAYYPSSWLSATSATRRSLPIAGPPTPALSDDSQPPRALSPPRVPTVWSLPPAAPTSLALSRQPTVRRPTRSRTTDFNEFTAQRRSSTRGGDSSHPTDSAPSEEPPWVRSSASRSTRRFFPFSHQARRHDLALYRNALGGGTPGEGSSSAGELSDEALYGPEASASTSTSFFPPSPLPPAATMPDVTSEERMTSSAGPRLRRGGVRPPESLLFERVSPGTVVVVPRSPPGADADEGANTTSTPEYFSAGLAEQVVAEADSYPTPGSPVIPEPGAPEDLV